MIRFVVKWTPAAQPRQRHRVAKKKTGQTFVQNYTPKDDPVNAFKEAVRLAASGSVMWLMAHGGMLTGPVELTLTFVLPRPQRLRKGGAVPHDVKPDWDNLGKAVSDALNGRIWVDDGQVCRAVLEKWYASSDEEPHVVVEVKPFVGTRGQS